MQAGNDGRNTMNDVPKKRRQKRGLYRTLSNRRKIAHTAQGTPQHALDKLVGEARSAERWLLLPAVKGEEDKRDFSMVTGGQYVLEGDDYLPVSPEDFVQFICELRSARIAYRGLKTRAGQRRDTQLRCENPLFEFSVTLAPWASDFLAVLAQTNPHQVEDYLVGLCRTLQWHIQSYGPEVVGFSVHTDTDDLHVNFVCSKTVRDESGVVRLKLGRQGMRLVGPWCTAMDRQRRAGVQYQPHDEKFERDLAVFRSRYPGCDLPNDIRMARLADAHFEAAFGIEVARRLQAEYRDRIERRREQAVDNRRGALMRELQSLDVARDSFGGPAEGLTEKGTQR